MTQGHWISYDQLRVSLKHLRSTHPFFGMVYLAFKAHRVPVGSQMRLRFSAVMRDFMQRYYRPIEGTEIYYYNPFRTSNPQNRWLTYKYPSGALQRITADTFRAAIIHNKGDTNWGWSVDYIDALDRRRAELGGSLIPIFHLAVWLYRQEQLSQGRAVSLVRRFEDEFHILPDERKLFDYNYSDEVVEKWTSTERLTERSVARLIGQPGESMSGSVAVGFMEFENVGPMRRLRYEPSRRLNLITGDNSLGKTFLLECLWWGLTGTWVEYSAAPWRGSGAKSSRILYCLSTQGDPWDFEAHYDYRQSVWRHTKGRRRPGSLAIFARHDGSYSIWDSMSPIESLQHPLDAGPISLSRGELWHGKKALDRNGNDVSVCNGLISDWVRWQTRTPRFESAFRAFKDSLKTLAPPDGQRFEVADPVWLPRDEREIPALRMDYGTVPVVHTSAGVKRVIALAYIVIWSWLRHKRNAALANRVPQDSMVVMVDEVEAHLHPRWQRSIVPAILRVVGSLSDQMSIQTHIATHSPLVLASAAPLMVEPSDTLHKLDVKEDVVTIKPEGVINYGSVNSWLVSDVFGLKHARSLEAERVIERAKRIQLQEAPSPDEVSEIDKQLVQVLRQDDEFWPRWRYFFESVVVALSS